MGHHPFGPFHSARLAKKPAGRGGSLAVGSSGQPPTDEEARQFAKSFAASVNASDVAGINAAIDWDAIVNRALVGCEIPAESYKEYVAGAKHGILGPNGLGAVIISQIKQGGEYRLLHLHQQDGQQRALFRLLLPSGGFNYHDIVLVRQADGKVRGDDIYIYAAGEMLSETMHRGSCARCRRAF